ncbi:MAG: circularly permuted type 2 ATP-grasp protein, partial [Pseudomonadota bacterium]
MKGSLASEPVVVRLFAAMTANGPEVMPGGLAISVGKQTQVGQDPVRGRTRDVWVLGDREAKSSTHQSLWRNTTAVARVQRSQRSLQSRVADDLFWLGRYAERADWTMRVLRSSLLKLLDDDGKLDKSGIVQSPLDPVRVSMGLLLSKSAAPGSPPVYDLQNDSIGQLSGLLIHNRACLYALAPTLDHVVRYAELTRDRLSFEAWTVLTSLRSGQPWRRLLESANVETLVDLLEDGLTVIASFNGLMQENMTRNHGWTFLSMGRRLERAYNLSDIMLALFQSPESEEAEWSAMLMLLEVADSYITYRSRYRLDPMFPLVVDLLLLDDTNPRSLFFQFEQIDRHLASLPLAQSPPSQSAKRRLILEAIDELRAIDPIEMAGDPSRNAFRDLLQSKLNMLPELSDAIGRRYF